MTADIVVQPRPKQPVHEKYKSRLMLTYRTNITGTPVPMRLPFRVLVLGKLTSQRARDLQILPDLYERKIESITPDKPGTSVNDYMAALMPWLPLDEKSKLQALKVEIQGAIELGEIDVMLTGDPPDNAAPFQATAFATFTSKPPAGQVQGLKASGLHASGNIKLKATSPQDKTPVVDENVTLKVRGIASMVVNDPTTGKPAGKLVCYLDDAKVEIDKALLEYGSTPVGDPANPTLRHFFKVKQTNGATTTFATPARQALPLTSLKSFTPDEIVQNVPELRRLRVIKDLVSEFQATLRNQLDVSRALKELVTKNRTALGAIQAWAKSNLDELKIVRDPPPAPNATPAPPVALDAGAKDSLGTLLQPLGSSADTLLKPAADGTSNGASLALVAEDQTWGVVFSDRDSSIGDDRRLVNGLAALLVNIDTIAEKTGPFSSNFNELYSLAGAVTQRATDTIGGHLNAVYHAPEFMELESNWRGLSLLADGVTSDDVIIDFFDVTKQELGEDFEDNQHDPFGSALFQKVYVDEYDRYGGHPFATMIGLYEFASQDGDVDWLDRIKTICAAAHCPFIASVDARFFGGRQSIDEVAAIADLDAIMNHPKMAKWNALRDDDWAAYIGLTLPRFLLRRPWSATDDPSPSANAVGYEEKVTRTLDDGVSVKLLRENLCWGNAAVLFAKNIVRSYENSGWAQHLRGPIGGGAVDGLVSYAYKRADGSEAFVNPIEIAIPDFREYQFARNGLIALVQKKDQASATFFSAQSIKRPKDFLEDGATKNAYLVTNLAYTFSITIIAHYVKAMMREYIGSTADAAYIQQSLSNWLGRYVTLVVNPDDLTLLYYPFKATSVQVEPKPGPFGWYKATISVLPHAQFEGMDVELRLEAGLGGKS